MWLLSLFSGPLSISERVYLFILFHPQKKILLKWGAGNVGEKKRDKTISTTSIERDLIQFLIRIEKFLFFQIDVFKRKEDEVLHLLSDAASTV